VSECHAIALLIYLSLEPEEISQLEAPYQPHPVRGLAPPAPALFGTRR
jgi:hypothetical protein